MKCNKCDSTNITYNSTEGHNVCDDCGNEILDDFESVDYFRPYKCCTDCGSEDILPLDNGSFSCYECEKSVDTVDDINSKINELHEYLIKNADKDIIKEFNRIFSRDEWRN